MLKKSFVAATFLVATLITPSVYSQNLVFSGPGQVVFPSTNSTPFQFTVMFQIASGSVSGYSTFNCIPSGKIFVCTNIAASIENINISSPHDFSLLVNSRMNSDPQGGYHVTRFSFDKSNDNAVYSVSPILSGQRQTLIYFDNQTDFDGSIQIWLQGSTGIQNCQVALSGFLIDK
jgi:hypothetical protein